MISRIAFLGCGSMGEAILAGLLSGDTPSTAVRATVRRSERAAELAERYGISVSANSEDDDANASAVAGAEVVVLGVKPNQIAQLCQEISSALDPNAVVVSVAGGVTIEQIERNLPQGQPVVRTMPNTPLKVRRGVVGLAAGSNTSAEHADLAESVFTSAGVVLRVPEEQMDALGGISGSGPAYFFYVAEALAKAAEAMGFDEEIAKTMANHTAIGAGYMLAEPEADAEQLRIAVTSPKGSTEQAIATFDAQGMRQDIEAGARAAAARSAEVSAELDS